MSARALVTGADGYVGRAVCDAFLRAGIVVRRGVRRLPDGAGGDWVAYGDLAASPDFTAAVKDCSLVIHLAAGVHLRGGAAKDAGALRQVNLDATLALAQAAGRAGVRRFVFASTLGVHAPNAREPLTESSAIAPATAYARSKWEAETALLGDAKGLDVTVIRPPMVYGPHCPGNMARIARLVRLGVPLPFQSLHNLRSLIHVENLAEAFVRGALVPEAAGEAFLVRDGEDLSTPELVRLLAGGMGKRPRLFPVPAVFLDSLARLPGLGGTLEKLTGNLRIDDAKARTILGFTPVRSMPKGIEETGRSFAGPN